MTRIKEIYLGLENVEIIKIPAEYILNFSASDNRKIISSRKDYLTEYEIYNKVSITISSEIKDFKNHESWMTEHGYENLNEYISARKDITSITIVHEDETEKTIYVNWTGDNEWENEEQYNYINKEGDVLITIGISEENRDILVKILN